jgi:hypothetical protein
MTSSLSHQIPLAGMALLVTGFCIMVFDLSDSNGAVLPSTTVLQVAQVCKALLRCTAPTLNSAVAHPQ